jgi:hypothetical protein
MKTIDIKSIKVQVSNCYEQWDPEWETHIGDKRVMNGFKSYLEYTAGVKLDFEVLTVHNVNTGYTIKSLEIVDDSAFTMWMLKWS